MEVSGNQGRLVKMSYLLVTHRSVLLPDFLFDRHELASEYLPSDARCDTSSLKQMLG